MAGNQGYRAGGKTWVPSCEVYQGRPKPLGQGGCEVAAAMGNTGGRGGEGPLVGMCRVDSTTFAHFEIYF